MTKEVNVGKRKDNHVLVHGVKVFGFQPYWMDSTYTGYNFSLLSHVSYFSYEVNPLTGGYYSIHGWSTNGLVAYAKKQNPFCKVLLTATCFGTAADSLLNSPSAQKTLISNLQTLVLSQKGDGVCIDFEDISQGKQAAFTAFIQQLSAAFKAKKLLVTITYLPSISTVSITLQTLARI